eukprot:scaffold29316_cov66-Cyclotella_meneghiniana.AAC.4
MSFDGFEHPEEHDVKICRGENLRSGICRVEFVWQHLSERVVTSEEILIMQARGRWGGLRAL